MFDGVIREDILVVLIPEKLPHAHTRTRAHTHTHTHTRTRIYIYIISLALAKLNQVDTELGLIFFGLIKKILRKQGVHPPP